MGLWDRAFTAKEKTKMTKDWLTLFPSLRKYKSMDIDNRVGPLMVGIYLAVIRGRLCVPTYAVHNFCAGYSSRTLSLILETKITLTPDTYERDYQKAAQELKSYNFFVPIECDLTIDQIIAGYKRSFKEEKFVTLTSHEDLPLICGWTGQADKIEDSLKIVYDDMIRVRKEKPFVFKEPGSFETWFNTLEKKAWDYEKLRQCCEEEVVSLKADKLPERKLIY